VAAKYSGHSRRVGNVYGGIRGRNRIEALAALARHKSLNV
jgi:hypothetical protein